MNAATSQTDMTTNAITLIVFLAFWPVWLAWEIYLLIKRGEGVNVKTLSMVARDRGWQLNSVVYVYCGLAAHFWWTWKSATTLGIIVFWGIAGGRLIGDVVLWIAFSDPQRWWHRNPLYWACFGILAGHFLFPQPA